MANELSIIIRAAIDPNSKQQQESLKKQLNTLASNLKLNVTIDANSISNLSKQIENLQKSLTVQGKGIKIIDESQLKDKILFKNLDEALNKYKQMGEVKITKDIDQATNQLKSFIIELNKANGIVEKMKFSAVNVAGKGDSINSAFLLDTTKVIDQTQKINEQMLQQRTSVSQKLEKQNQKEYDDYIKKEEQKTQKEQQETTKRQALEQKESQNYEEFWIKALNVREQKIEEFQRKAEILAQKTRTKYGTNAEPFVQDFLSGASNLSNFGDISKESKRLKDNLDLGIASIQNSKKEIYDWGQMLEVATKKVAVWAASTTLIYGTLHFFQNGAQFVKELNDNLTQISTATNKSQEEVLKLGSAYQKLGQELGATTKEVSAGALEFYRQGLNDSQVLERLKLTTEYAKISGLDFKKSAELLTATTNSMNVSVGKAADVFTYLGDATATGKIVPPIRAIA